MSGYMNLTDVIAVWDELHKKNVGELGFSDLRYAIEKVVGIHDDTGATNHNYPPMQRNVTSKSAAPSAWQRFVAGGGLFGVLLKWAIRLAMRNR